LERLVCEDPRLPVESDVLDVFEPDARGGQTVRDRAERKADVVLFTGESLLLDSGNDVTVAQQRSRCVSEGGQAEYVHSLSWHVWLSPAIMSWGVDP
jgi:hypothetical protein